MFNYKSEQDKDETIEAPTVNLMKSSIFSYEQAWHVVYPS